MKKADKRRVKKSPRRVKTSHHKFYNLSLFFGVFGILLTIISFFNLLKPYIDGSPKRPLEEASIQEATMLQVRDAKIPTHIKVGNRIDLPLVPGAYLNNTWTLSDTYPLYLTNGAYPKEGGNVIIYGHNTKSVFGALQNVQPHELVTITLKDGSNVTYEVSWVKRVDPKNLEFIQPQQEEMLTLYTCSGVFDRERFVARAYPVEN